MQDLNDLYYFAVVVDHGGFAAAERALGIPKSRLSRRISQLEGELGVRLLQRSTRRFAVTDVGQSVYRHAQSMLAEATAAREVVDRRWSGGRILTLDGYPHRGQPICLSEFGGIAWTHDPGSEPPNGWGYARARTAEEYEHLALSLIEIARTTGMFSAFCYTQFTDTFQEINGLLHFDRTPKIPLERIAAAVTGTGTGQPPRPP